MKFKPKTENQAIYSGVGLAAASAQIVLFVYAGLQKVSVLLPQMTVEVASAITVVVGFLINRGIGHITLPEDHNVSDDHEKA